MITDWFKSINDKSNITNSIIKNDPLIFDCQINNSIIVGISGIILDLSNIKNSKIINYKQLIHVTKSEIQNSQILDSNCITDSKLKNCSIISAGIIKCDFENVTMVGCGHEVLKDLIYKDCFLVSDGNSIYEFDLVLPPFLEPITYKHMITSDMFKMVKHKKTLWG